MFYAAEMALQGHILCESIVLIVLISIEQWSCGFDSL